MNKLVPFFIFLISCSHSVFGQDVFDAARTGNLKRMEELIKIKPDTVNTKNTNGFSPLIIAAYRNQTEMVKFLLNHNADINMDSPEGPVILGTCFKGNLEITKLLIAYKADVNAVNIYGTSALMYAATSKNVELVRLLLQHGAKKNAVDKSGKNALDYAKAGGLTEISTLLSE